MNSLQTELDQAVAAAGRALLTMHGLMAAHGIPNVAYLELLLSWPAGMRDAYNGWMAAMIGVVNALGHSDGIQDMRALSDKDKIQLAIRSHNLVLDSQFDSGIRPRLAAITGVSA